MSRILLADHSPHAQRMGERILRDEGFEVVTVTDGDTALLRLKDIEPDLILADISLPSRNGYEICDYVKNSGKYPNTRVVLTAGPLVPLDQTRATARPGHRNRGASAARPRTDSRRRHSGSRSVHDRHHRKCHRQSRRGSRRRARWPNAQINYA